MFVGNYENHVTLAHRITFRWEGAAETELAIRGHSK